MGSSWRETVRRRQAEAIEAGTEEAQAARGELEPDELENEPERATARVV
jgi:hypothetical protein